MSTVLDMTLTDADARMLTATRQDVEKAKNDLAGMLLAQRFAIRTAATHGASYREIAELAGVSHQRVAQIINA